MTQFDAVASGRRIRMLHRKGMITHAEFAVAETMLWSCRGRGGDRASASYRRIAELAHVAKGTAVKAVAALIALGVFRKDKRRVLVPWLGGMASRQATNVYVFAAAAITEFSEWPVYGKQVSKEEGKAVWRRANRPEGPVRTVAEQLAMLREAA